MAGRGMGRDLARRCAGFLFFTCSRKLSSVAAIASASAVAERDFAVALGGPLQGVPVWGVRELRVRDGGCEEELDEEVGGRMGVSVL